jgi:hypothetical protein
MAIYSRNDLRNAVMYDLSIIDAGRAPEPQDAIFVNDKCQQVLEQLADDGLIPFDLDADAIPAPYMIPLARVIAPTLCTAYGLGAQLNTFEALATQGLKDLRRLKARPYYGTVAPADYF